MSLSIPKITTAVRKIDFSSLNKVDFSAGKKVDMSKICSIYPNPATKKVNFIEAVMNFMEKFTKKA